ncbi:MAG TPA: hypothetical protein PKY30_15515 [Myxococcota bacterium]|nr:hypothetical protein [Myxococcota bacterium]HNH48448.1 hypothetical protein [Myxococcota bacterium]
MEEIESIEETTVGLLGGQRVPMGNVTRGSYTLPDGAEAQGWICALALPTGGAVFVGAGSEVEIAGRHWTVLKVEKEPGKLGQVFLRSER